MPQIYFYATDGETVITLDAITDINENLTANKTSTRVQSGSTVTDHYVVDDKAVSVTGVISEIKVGGNGGLLSVSSFADEMDRLIYLKQPFLLVSERDGVFSIPEVLITSFNKMAYGADGLTVSITFSESRFVKEGQFVDIEVSNPKKDGEGGESTVTGEADAGEGGTKKVGSGLLTQFTRTTIEFFLGEPPTE